jgi:FtsP/CotA-like multicopper oxidase with cupredoxin domain
LLTRRQVIVGAAGVAGAASLAGVAGAVAYARRPRLVGPTADAVARAEVARHRTGSVVAATLTPRPVTVDLGGPTVRTWAYTEQLPGTVLRAKPGDLLRVEVVNGLPADTSVHWHGLALRNDMDGVPGVTQRPIAAGGRYTYEFTVPDPGTYWYHPHAGVQLDRGLYGALIVDDPTDPGRYDAEWVVVLDDWVDGTGRTPDDVFRELATMSGMNHGMGGMAGDHMAGMGMETMVSPLLGGAGDVAYPHYLINGRIPSSPTSFISRPGQRARLRLINAASDTAFRVALGGHRLTVSHTDGFPVTPTATDALVIAMGERIDVTVDLADGAFPLVALPEGKTGQALAVVRTGAGDTPATDARPRELDGGVLLAADLRAAEGTGLAARSVDRTHDLVLGGGMMPYRWTINGQTFHDGSPLPVRQDERVRLRLVNRTTMFHPMHLHGHTFQVAGGGALKDTVVVKPNQTVTVDLDADNPGQWMTHCHNAYHAEAGMMATLGYLA